MPSFAMGSWLQKWRFCRNPSPPKGWRSKFAKCWIARPEAEPASPLEGSRLGGMLERETGFEPAALAWAGRCSTTELFPPRSQEKRNYTGITREASRRGHDERSTTGQPAGWARLESSHRLAEGRPDSGERRTRQRGGARRRRTSRQSSPHRFRPAPSAG